ncbi:unnamed protein product [Callosobruchus maculatus]|uniref:Uncharacterized protein n=1 Tax=Callosobruchus maculatus TaxID=64391 RepID=A0A653DE82_CALMS|nr:unnamed protein product [Callosobruchus maculatus]
MQNAPVGQQEATRRQQQGPVLQQIWLGAHCRLSTPWTCCATDCYWR